MARRIIKKASKPTTAIVLDKRYSKKEFSNPIDTRYPVKLRVTYAYEQKYYELVNPDKPGEKILYDLTTEDFNRVMGQKAREEFKTIKTVLSKVEQKAINIITALPSFAFDEFKRIYFNKIVDIKDVFSAFDDYTTKLRTKGRIGTAISYNNAKCSLKSFAGKDSLMFEKITPEFLKDWEQWLIGKDNSAATCGIYSRSLRTIINSGNYITEKNYPFGKGRYEIPTSANPKKALDINEIGKIFKYKPKNENESLAKDFFILSYLANGMNFADICKLKCSDISNTGKYFEFLRAKTIRTSKKKIKVHVAITPQIQAIIDKRKATEGQYLFPILNKDMDAKKEYDAIKQFTKNVNNAMKEIAKNLKLGKEPTTYHARHSFSTILMRSGIPISFISKALGHRSMSTTENYLADFEHETYADNAQVLTRFNR